MPICHTADMEIFTIPQFGKDESFICELLTIGILFSQCKDHTLSLWSPGVFICPTKSQCLLIMSNRKG